MNTQTIDNFMLAYGFTIFKFGWLALCVVTAIVFVHPLSVINVFLICCAIAFVNKMFDEYHKNAQNSGDDDYDD